jgi:carbonic anhydrase
MEGNRRYVEGRLTRLNQSPSYRAVLTEAQSPFAVILGCSDSRVPAEIIFDQGLGDLFVVRVAGNVLDEGNVLGSIEYAVAVLNVPLIVVLGHERCGAVREAVDAVRQQRFSLGHIENLARRIRPAVERVRNDPGDWVDNAIAANIREVVRQLHCAEPVLARGVSASTLKVAGACYSLETGVVSLLD